MDIIVGDAARQACIVTFDNADLAAGWLLMLIDKITPATWIKIVKAVTHGNADAIINARALVNHCLGTAV